MNHITAVSHVLTSRTVQAECICGWKGPVRNVSEVAQAERDGQSHERQPDTRGDDAEILYTYITASVLPILKSNGVWAAPDPAPLDSATVVEQFKRIIEHDNYDEQTLLTQCNDGAIVRAKEGEVKIIEPPNESEGDK